MKTPRYLLGAALLFWGWQTGLSIWAVPMAVILEAPNFLRTRWELSLADLNRIWNLCAVLFFGAAVILYSSEDSPVSVPLKFMQWLPFPFFPMMLAQAYGSAEKIPMSVLSWFLRRSPDSSLAKKAFNISFGYFAICLLAASATSGASSYFYPGIVVLITLALMANRPTRIPQPVWIVLIAVVGFAGQIGHQQLHALHGAVEGTLARWLVSLFSRDYRINESRTAIGRVGHIALSGKIALRVQPESGQNAPELLRDASYDTYKSGVWRSSESEFKQVSTDTNDVAVLQSQKPLNFSVRIASYLNRGRGFLALPHGAFELENFPAVLKTNQFGVAKVEEGPGLLNIVALYGPGTTIDAPPVEADNAVPLREKAVVKKVVRELNLDGKSDRAKLKIIQQFFQNNFTYSLDIGRNHIDPTGQKTPLGQFLTEARSGHCEYFASAAVMLLREAGIPARYATGYLVDESQRKGKTYLVRERDGHAWALAYRKDKKVWEEFDATPASSVRARNSEASAWEPVSDFFSNLKFQFLKWRWSKTTYTSYLKWFLIPLIAFLAWRILFNKRRKNRASKQEESSRQIWPGMDSEFYLLERKLASAGFARGANESLSEWQERISQRVPEPENLVPIFQIHRRLRFDPLGVPSEVRRNLRNDVSRWLDAFDLQQREENLRNKN